MSDSLRYLGGLVASTILVALASGCDGPVPPSSAAMLREAAAAYQRSDDVAASQRLGKFIAAHPQAQETGEAYYLRGLVRCRSGYWDGAEADFLQAIELTRRDDLRGHAHLALAYCAQRRGDDEAASVSYLAALETPGMRSVPTEKALYGLGALLQRQGQWLEADRRFDRLTHLFGDTDEAAAAGRRVRGRAWTIRVGSFDRREGAQRLVGRLTEQGLEPRMVVTGPTVRFEVLVGRYPTWDQATEAAAALAESVPSAVITTARD